MKLVQYAGRERTAIGALSKDGKKLIPISTEGLPAERDPMVALIRQTVTTVGGMAALRQRVEAAEEAGEGLLPLEGLRILAPILYPRHDVLCVGVNYLDHAKEAGEGVDESLAKPPEKAIFFSKRVLRMLGPEESIDNPWEIEQELDYEVELAVVIGEGGRNIPKEEVAKHIFGYGVFNDISARQAQRERKQWYTGKSIDGFSAMGPYLCTADELRFPPDLAIMSRVNGELRQNARTSLFLRDPAELIADVSRYMTLEAGDILATGTPAGVAMGMAEPKWLRPGDVVECEIEGMGVLRNPVR